MGDRQCTLFDVSAISGAAISPLMGAATRHAYRLLFTSTNVRLGVWLPHPNVVRDARKLLNLAAQGHRDGAENGRAHAADHPGRAEPGRDPMVDTGGRCSCCSGTCRRTRSGIVRRTRTPTGRPGSGPTCSSSGSAAGWPARCGTGSMQPTLGLLWAEAAGQPELPQHLDVRDRRGPLREPRAGRGAAPRGQARSWCSTPPETRQTRGPRSAAPSRWPGQTRGWRSR